MSLIDRVRQMHGVAGSLIKNGITETLMSSDPLRRMGLGFALRNTDISDLRSICVMLGPHRNLTTLLAALMFLHPRCQVLNHAETRILGHSQVDFLQLYSPERMQRFIHFAIDLSVRGRSSWFGGSMLNTHAFSPRYEIRKTFDLSGGVRLKPQIQCLLWKGAMKVSNHLREHQIDMGQLTAADSRLRFLLPVRNPLDTAVSTFVNGSNFMAMYPELRGDGDAVDQKRVLDAVLSTLHWGFELHERHPRQLFVLYEDDIGPQALDELRRFLDLDEDPQWLENCRRVSKINPKAQHSAELQRYYRQRVMERFADLPAVRERLLNFVPSAQPDAADAARSAGADG